MKHITLATALLFAACGLCQAEPKPAVFSMKKRALGPPSLEQKRITNILYLGEVNKYLYVVQSIEEEGWQANLVQVENDKAETLPLSTSGSLWTFDETFETIYFISIRTPAYEGMSPAEAFEKYTASEAAMLKKEHTIFRISNHEGKDEIENLAMMENINSLPLDMWFHADRLILLFQERAAAYKIRLVFFDPEQRKVINEKAIDLLALLPPNEPKVAWNDAGDNDILFADGHLVVRIENRFYAVSLEGDAATPIMPGRLDALGVKPQEVYDSFFAGDRVFVLTIRESRQSGNASMLWILDRDSDKAAYGVIGPEYYTNIVHADEQYVFLNQFLSEEPNDIKRFELFYPDEGE